MPSERLLQAARDGFPHSIPSDERESVLQDITRAIVLTRNIQEKMPYDENDQEYHDIRSILAALGRAAAYVRHS